MNSSPDKENKIILKTNSINKTYPDQDKNKDVFEDISFEVYQGEIVSILGLSGAGKTTLFNVLAGLTKADKGNFEVKAKLSYMFQKDLLLPWKKIIDNISLPLILDGWTKEDSKIEAMKHLNTFGIAGLENRYPNEISGGERRRAELLRTYLDGGKIILLDEPFTGIDPVNKKDIQDWLKGLVKRTHLTLLLITHDLEEAIHLSDRIYVLQAGDPSRLTESIPVKNCPKKELLEKLMEKLYIRL